MKKFAGICVHKPENALKVIETLIENRCAVVLDALAYDPCGETIFMVGYGEVEDGYEARHHFEDVLSEIYGHVAEVGEVNDAVPLVGLQFAIDVFDDQSGITHRISCAKYSPERAYKMAIEAAGLLLNNLRVGSLGNALARRMMQVALGGGVGVEEPLKKKAA